MEYELELELDQDRMVRGMLKWLRGRALANRRIDAADLAELQLVSNPAEVVRIVNAARARQEAQGRRQ